MVRAWFTADDRLLPVVARSPTGERFRLFTVETAGGHLLAGPADIPRVAHVAASPDGRTVAASAADGSITAWDAAAGRESARFRGHVAPGPLSFWPSGRLLASCGPVTPVFVWHVPAAPAERD